MYPRNSLEYSATGRVAFAARCANRHLVARASESESESE